MPTVRNYTWLIAVLVIATAAALTVLPAAEAEDPRAGWGVDREDGVQTGRQDVYFLDDDGVLRNPDGETPADAPLFNVAGVPLDFTWGEYDGAEASSLAFVTSVWGGPRTTFIVQLEGLVPGGVYSVFYTNFGPDTENPDCPNALRDLPVGAIGGRWQKPDASSFIASHDGRAVFVGRVEGNLLEPVQLSLQIIYHADGETYHPLPNRGAFETQGPDCRSSYGVDAMRQLFILQKWIF